MTAQPETPATAWGQHGQSVFQELILFQLAGVLAFGPAADDPALARQAAEEAIAAHSPQSPDEPLVIAQITALGISALDNDRLAMPGDVTITHKLKLRGSAAAMSRASLQLRTGLHRTRLMAESAWEEDEAYGEDEPEPQQFEPATQTGTETASRPEPPLTWSEGMAAVAEDLKARAETGSPRTREANAMWAKALTQAANDIQTAPPNRKQLLATTLMSNNTKFPLPKPPKPAT